MRTCRVFQAFFGLCTASAAGYAWADSSAVGTTISSLRFIPASLVGPNLGSLYPVVRGSCASRRTARRPESPTSIGGRGAFCPDQHKQTRRPSAPTARPLSAGNGCGGLTAPNLG